MRAIDFDAIVWHDYLVPDGNGMYHDEKIAYKSQIDDLPAAQPSVSDCWGCNCPKMERKTFSEMVHLHDEETHDKRTETHGVCLDTISRQDAIDAIEETDWYHIGKTGELIHGANSQEHEPLYKARDIYVVLEHLPSAQPEQRWIPCSKRLPEARRSVILSTKDGWTGEGCYWETTEHHVIWKGYRWNATYWDDEVTAWKPLPEPWKGEEE